MFATCTAPWPSLTPATHFHMHLLPHLADHGKILLIILKLASRLAMLRERANRCMPRVWPTEIQYYACCETPQSRESTNLAAHGLTSGWLYLHSKTRKPLLHGRDTSQQAVWSKSARPANAPTHDQRSNQHSQGVFKWLTYDISSSLTIHVFTRPGVHLSLWTIFKIRLLKRSIPFWQL